MSDESFFRVLTEQLESRGRIALATVVETRGSGPSKDGRRFLIFEDGSFSGTIGGGPFEALVVADAAALFHPEGPRRFVKWYDFFEREIGGDDREPTNMICGGSARVVVERLEASPALLVLGGGHVGLALARIASSMGFEVVVADDRQEYSRPERFPPGVRALQAGRDYAVPPDALPSRRDLYVAVVTRCWETDLAALRPWLLPGARETRYLGLIGSARKIRGVFDRLLEEGVAEEAIRKVRAPIGLEIGAVTPEEIAVSILAEMTQVRRAAGSRPRTREKERVQEP
jgi:xanthine dehydrogenase accessory factor